MTIFFWWLRQFVLTAVSAFFLYFGIRLLISAYRLNDPFIFIMTFFAANFIILISGTLVVCFLYRIKAALRSSENSENRS